MKFFWRMMFFVLVGLILTMGGISAAMAQSEAPQVTLSFNKESVNVGEEVTASYEVVGGSGKYKDFYISIEAVTHGQPEQGDMSHTLKYEISSEKTGSISAVVKFGYSLYAYLIFEDENGQSFYYRTEEIPVYGDTTVFPTAVLTFDKSSVNIGETVTVSYEVTGGNGKYKDFYISIEAVTHGQPEQGDMSHTLKYEISSEKTGSISAVVKFGYSLYAYLIFEDENGQSFYYRTEEIPVYGDTTVFPTALLTFDKNSINIGETVTVGYEVTGGNGKYKDFYISIEAVTHGQPEHGDMSHTLEYRISSEKTGSISAVVKFGYSLYAYLIFEDENGQSFYYESEKLPVSGTTGTVTYYEVIEDGGNPVYTGNGALTFRINADFEKFRALLVDDRPVSESGYTAWSGSTYVSLKESYLDTLSEGTHTLSALFSDGYAETTFIVGPSAAATPPRTGDTAMPYLWLTACLLAGAGFFCGLRRAKKHS